MCPALVPGPKPAQRSTLSVEVEVAFQHRLAAYPSVPRATVDVSALSCKVRTWTSPARWRKSKQIHEQIAKGEVYRGYRSLPVAVSGLIGIVAAWLQPRDVGHGDPVGFVIYWTAVAGVAAFVGVTEIVRNYIVHDDAAARRRTRRVIGQFLPSLLGGADHHRQLRPPERGARAAAAGHLGDLLRHRHVRVTAVSAAGERARRAVLLRAGVVLLWIARGPEPLAGWWVGGTFGARPDARRAGAVLEPRAARERAPVMDDDEEEDRLTPSRSDDSPTTGWSASSTRRRGSGS